MVAVILRGPYRYRNDEREAEFNRFIRSSDRASHENIRMNHVVLYTLVEQLRNYGLIDTRYVTREEQVAWFLMTIGQDWCNHNVYSFFRFGQTIHQYFHVVLNLLVRLFRDTVKAI